MWRQLERDSIGLKDLLAKRAKGIEEVDSLALQNVELRRLLNQYLGDSTVNNYMIVPPGQVIKVRDRTSLVAFKSSASNNADSRESFIRMQETKYRKSKSVATILSKTPAFNIGGSDSMPIRVGSHYFPEILGSKAGSIIR